MTQFYAVFSPNSDFPYLIQAESAIEAANKLIEDQKLELDDNDEVEVHAISDKGQILENVGIFYWDSSEGVEGLVPLKSELAQAIDKARDALKVKKYRVFAAMTTSLYIDVAAHSEEEALNTAKSIDGAEFKPQNDFVGDWRITMAVEIA